MKKWMTFVVSVQVASSLIWLAQAVRLWRDDLWFVSWILGVPGSVLGHWAADQLLWMRASHWIIGLAGLAAATLINLAVAYVLGAACKRIVDPPLLFRLPLRLVRRRSGHSTQDKNCKV